MTGAQVSVSLVQPSVLPQLTRYPSVVAVALGTGVGLGAWGGVGLVVGASVRLEVGASVGLPDDTGVGGWKRR